MISLQYLRVLGNIIAAGTSTGHGRYEEGIAYLRRNFVDVKTITSACDTPFSMSNSRYESVGADTRTSTLENMLIILGKVKAQLSEEEAVV